jgi:hypothetical protein
MLELPEEKIKQIYLDIFAEGRREIDSTNLEYELFTMLNPNPNGVYINWGAGLSKTSEVAKKMGFNLLNYDPGIPSEYNYEDIDKLSINKVDGIISNNVLDHLQNPIESLLHMKSLLKSGCSMIHASDGFKYVIHYTKFHLFFFVGKSVKYISNSIKMPYSTITCSRQGTDVVKFTKVD